MKYGECEREPSKEMDWVGKFLIVSLNNLLSIKATYSEEMDWARLFSAVTTYRPNALPFLRASRVVTFHESGIRYGAVAIIVIYVQTKSTG